MTNLPLESEEPTQQTIRNSMIQRCFTRSEVQGSITLPAVPSLIDEYVSMCETIFAAVGRKFNEEELAHLRKVLEGQLAAAFSASPRSSIVITYNAPVGPTLHYEVNARWWSLAETYDNWTRTREPPLFGKEPDARIWDLANEAPDPAACRVLEIGPGTGRNALPLARRGHPVDVVELTPKFAELLREAAEKESLDIRVIVRDVFQTTQDLRQDYQLIALSEVVPDFRNTQQLRGLFEIAAECLAPGGRIVFSTFLAAGGYIPDQAAREFGQQVYSAIFTRHEMARAAGGLPLELVADDSVYEYEKANLPPGAWPPTGWYENWITGLDVFPVGRESSPIELRWLVFQKTR
ncbi:SAM-dependent methyltransferase [Mycobacterium intermedium]|uniref:SAM-dependent methyltransferase n=1 Tax=Mycobacterium intermedium TaxID=28445 RepID=A0A1E3SM03_MYCIE|nr:class I SAM-dependent methyltransferase [Mycobacterium intermedium]MCV6964638.1 class I SAM-dependent methyltransferase [Mycobacterium intermedium]ODR03176.1 methyltransferase type 12 [Mycobacterium intermedium]OPE45316.1 SAM-dependent methyltransferase [Mycobacterium intermedium]ORB05543.1 SAM-dependent methyltransferase [Mycobacterium intermedium]